MDLTFLALLACPLLMGAMFFFILKGNQPKESSKTDELKKDMNQLMEKNERLIKEIESLKKSR